MTDEEQLSSVEISDEAAQRLRLLISGEVIFG